MQSACAVLFCHMQAVWLHHIFPHYFVNIMIFEKKVIEHKKCFHFIYRFCTKHFSLQVEFNEILRYIYRGVHVKYPLFLSDCSETWIFSTHFLVIPKYKISWKSASGNRVVPCGQTDRHWRKDGRVNRQKDEAHSHFLQFCERVWKIISKYMNILSNIHNDAKLFMRIRTIRTNRMHCLLSIYFNN